MTELQFGPDRLALDMQGLVFHPRDQDIPAVGCNDGSIYVWDARNPDDVRHHFEQSESIASWDHQCGTSPMSWEQGDAGVNMTLWGAGKHRLYSGATDGVGKCWDISRAFEDTFVRDEQYRPDHDGFYVDRNNLPL